MKHAQDAKTLEALLGSIEKWRKIAYENGKDYGAENCPLCQTFRNCDHCIVGINKSAYHISCNTIYEKWQIHHIDEHLDCLEFDFVSCDECQRLAIAEYKFLKRLLPSGVVD